MPPAARGRAAEGVAEDLDLRPVRGFPDRDDVEPAGRLAAPLPREPRLGGAEDAPLLLGGDGLRRQAEPLPSPPLHLHEADDAVLFRDEVDLARFHAEVALDDAITGGLEPLLRESLPVVPDTAEPSGTRGAADRPRREPFEERLRDHGATTGAGGTKRVGSPLPQGSYDRAKAIRSAIGGWL